MTPIQSNKPVFFDSEGGALNGSIYIGNPDESPRTSPKTVTLRDSGGVEFAAGRPLNVKDGRITYNGSPIVALVSGSYSMLTLDQAGAQVDYSPNVDAPAVDAGELSGTIRFGLTLADIKVFDVSVGNAVRNIGNLTAADGGGADWLVTSNTGSPGNDTNLIDFTNGLQGQKYTIAGA